MKTSMQLLAAWTCLMLFVVSCTDMGNEPDGKGSEMNSFPSQMGDSWTYSVSDNVQKTNTFASVTVTGKMAGLPPVWLWEVNNGGVIETRYCQILGDTLKMHYWDDEVFTTITYVFPLQAGKKWLGSPSGHNSSVVSIGQVEVPAGSFQSCFQVQETWGTSDDYFEVCSWLVNDVGVVKLTLKRTYFGHLFNDVTWELTSYQVNQ